jgi:hypothetical protein
VGWHAAGMFRSTAPQVMNQFERIEGLLASGKVGVVPVDTEWTVLEALEKMCIALVQQGVLTMIIAPEVCQEDQDGSKKILCKLVGWETVPRELWEAIYQGHVVKKEEKMDGTETHEWVAVKGCLAKVSRE